MNTFEAAAFAPTPDAARYAAQMCKHFAHKVEAAFADGAGDIDFKFARARLEARADGLAMRASADDLAGLARAKYVLEDHLLRFAFRENLARLAWSGPETPAPSVPPGTRPTKAGG